MVNSGECWKSSIFLYWEEKDMVVHMFIVTIFWKKFKEKDELEKERTTSLRHY